MIEPTLKELGSQTLTCMQLSSKQAELDILHIGEISNCLYAFFETEDTTLNPANLEAFGSNFDIVLINSDCQMHSNCPSTVNDTELKVTYTKTPPYINKSSGFIDSSLIPILLKYLLKIKSTFHELTGVDSKNNINSFLKQVDTVIDEHIDDHSLNMERLSYLLGMSRSTFSKRVKEYTGLKPTEYVNEYKLEKSKHFLIITNWQVSRISDVLGFSTQQYYCRLFKKKEGISPSQFRINNKNSIV
ncbi:helix-turn-helix domain-containing protein [Flavivirga algicola]|uniref:Helix-turn-helix transcriptional regulator n=1 Tax=Flavivirga algicola TaxID=2729136 RepID=A0ABX1S2K3_9FLAO|nr:helix-turn-helix transcriptional regulator [Flavivirga algicola]NMH88780.1 helix-turn-helix transcriptional regulator [Flavivirga algicola]